MVKTIKKKKAGVIAPVEKKPKALLDRNKMAGGYLPPALADKFSLYAVYKGLSRSHVICDLVEKELSKEAPSTPTMVNDIAKRLLLLKADNMSMHQYKITASGLLNKKRLTVDQIEAIIKRMEEIENGSKKEKDDAK